MAKDSVFMGVAAVGGAGLGYALSKLMGGKSSAELEEAVSLINISRDPPYQYWLDRKFLLSYVHGAVSVGFNKAALYAFCYNDENHHDNPEVLVGVTAFDAIEGFPPGSQAGQRMISFECTKMAGDPGYRVYYKGMPKVFLNTAMAYTEFIV
jgi:hypothetical protein